MEVYPDKDLIINALFVISRAEWQGGSNFMSMPFEIFSLFVQLWYFSETCHTHIYMNSTCAKIVCTYDQEIPQSQTANPWHREEEPHNNHEKPGRQTKHSNHLSLPHQDYCKTRMDINQRTAKHRPITYFHNGSNNKQQVNNNRTIALEWTAA